MVDVTCSACGRSIVDPGEAKCEWCGHDIPKSPVVDSGRTAAKGEGPAQRSTPDPEGDPFGSLPHRAVILLGVEREIRLQEGDRFVVGRSNEGLADLCGDNISWCHAEIYVTPSGTFIEDTNSTNGTSVNGERLQPRSPQKLTSTASLQFASDPPLSFVVAVDGNQ